LRPLLRCSGVFEPNRKGEIDLQTKDKESTHEGTGTPADDYKESREIRDAGRQWIASIINNGKVIRDGENRQCLGDWEGESFKVGDWSMRYPTDSGILEGNDSAVVKYQLRVRLKRGEKFYLSKLATEMTSTPFPGLDVYQEPEAPYVI
jgi:hypothetical protein